MLSTLDASGGGAPNLWRSIGEAIRIAIWIWIAISITTGLGELRDLRIHAEAEQVRVGRIESALQAHSDKANAANLALSRILGIIDARLARLECADEWRRGNGGRAD